MAVESSKKILMTGGGAPGAYGVLHCLMQDKNLEIISADAREDCIGKHLTDRFIQIPYAQNPLFLDTMLNICEEENIDFLFPLVTKELIILSQHLDKFQAIGTTVLVNSFEFIQNINDKGNLYNFLDISGVPVPDFVICNNRDEFQQALNVLGYPEKPICLKPCQSNGMRGFRILDANKDKFDLWLNEKPSSAYITVEEIVGYLDHKDCPPLLVSEFLPGDEYTVDTFTSDGKTRYIIPRLRSKMVNGISAEGKIEKNEGVISYCQDILDKIKPDGLTGIQVKMNASGEPRILEINPRVQGTTVACLGAGVNLPLMAIQYANGNLDLNSLPDVDWDLKFIRHWKEVFYK
jgi:carbamoyl-phosphate synthase large subunit